MNNVSIVWFRRDLRLAHNPALEAALRRGGPVLCCYIHAPDEEAPWSPGAASRVWLHHSLAALDADLRSRGSRLVLLRGETGQVLADLAAQTDADSVFWNRLYEPAITARDARIKQLLRERGLQVASHAGHLLVEPWQIQTGEGKPFRVFTPFWRKLRAGIEFHPTSSAPERMPPSPPVDGLDLGALGLRPRLGWDAAFMAFWEPGETGAWSSLESFTHELGRYRELRDRPDLTATSRLSPHLHFGEISPLQVAHALRSHLGGDPGGGPEWFLRELGWREFSQHLLFHFPHVSDAPLDRSFEAFEWSEDARLLAAWQQGQTGIPIVDAGMRELWTSGWMHNRVRMIVASLLTRNLRQHWLHGARWFWDTLLDADLANNSQGWQWGAGCGADAAPYFRIFNPVLQGEKFDPAGRYVRRWVPEIARLPDRWLHQPWQAPDAVRRASGVSSSTYPDPIVDLKRTRESALAAYADLRARPAPVA